MERVLPGGAYEKEVLILTLALSSGNSGQHLAEPAEVVLSSEIIWYENPQTGLLCRKSISGVVC